MKCGLSSVVRISALALAVSAYARGGVAAPECTDCPTGKYCAGGLKAPVPCPVGHYCPKWAPGANAKIICPEGTYNDQTGKSSESDCMECEGGASSEDRKCCAGLLYYDGGCKSEIDVLAGRIDAIYAHLRSQNFILDTAAACTTQNAGHDILSSKISDKDLLKDPWGGKIEVRSGSTCGCVDFYLTNLSKAKCDYIYEQRAVFTAKSEWCDGYGVARNETKNACENNNFNKVWLYYDKWQ
jgi:hypothetical protein